MDGRGRGWAFLACLAAAACSDGNSPDLAGQDGGSGADGGGAGGAGAVGGTSGAGGTGGTTGGCAVALEDAGDACTGMTCPVTLNALVDCEAGATDLRAAAASTDRGYVWFYQQAPATSRGYAMLASIDGGGGSAVEQLADEIWRQADVAAGPAGDPVVFGVTDTGIARFAGGMGNWTRTTVAGDAGAPHWLDAAIDAGGAEYVLHAYDGVPLLLASNTGGGWTEQEIAGPRAGIASLGLGSWDAFALGLAANGTPHVVYWERGATEGSLEHVAGSAEPATLGTRVLSAHASALRILAPDSESGPIVGLVENQEIQLLVPDGAGGHTPVALPSPLVSVRPTGCMQKLGSGPCPAEATYTETSDGIQGSGYALARTADGIAWLAYAERHVECDYMRTEELSESGPQCISRITDDRSGTEIVIAELRTGASAAIIERFRGPIDGADATELAADASGSHLHVAAVLYRSTVIGASDRGAVRYLVIDTGQL